VNRTARLVGVTDGSSSGVGEYLMECGVRA
jgi:hypothetical protein